MSTENEMWRDKDSEEGQDAGRDGNRSYNRDNNYNREGGYHNRERSDRPSFNKYGERPSRPSFNREGNERSERPRFNREGGERPRFNRNDADSRPRFNREEGGERPRFNRDSNDSRPRFNRDDSRPRFNREEGGERPRFNRDNNEGRPRFNREEGERSYNREGGERRSFNREDRPQRPYNQDNNARPYRPSYNREQNFNRENRSWNNHSQDGEERTSFRKPVPNSENSFNRERNDDGYQRRPRFNAGEGGGSSYGSNRGGGYNRGGYNNDRGGYNNNRGGQGFARPTRTRSADYDPNAKYSMKKQIEYKEAYADPNEPVRLNKYLANAGICSRREADEFITAGAVTVNGEVVTELGTKIKRSDLVTFHDQPVSAERKVYILLNKPKDCVTTSDDPQERRTVMDLVKDACNERIYPVGRLDRNTTGVLLLTNDGDLASKLTHPQYMKKKIYHVYLDKPLTKADMDQISTGIQLDDGEIHADAISYASDIDKKQVGIEIHSGKNRIVRRIFETLGYRVIKLDRVYFAGLTKKSLRRGDWRYLTEQEVNFLRMGSFE